MANVYDVKPARRVVDVTSLCFAVVVDSCLSLDDASMTSHAMDSTLDESALSSAATASGGAAVTSGAETESRDNIATTDAEQPPTLLPVARAHFTDDDQKFYRWHDKKRDGAC